MRVLQQPQLRQAWGEFVRDEYTDGMAQIAGCTGVVKFQHPSGAFTVAFRSGDGGVPAAADGEEPCCLSFKLPPRALEVVDELAASASLRASSPPPRRRCNPPSPDLLCCSWAPSPAAVAAAECVASSPPPFEPGQSGLDPCLEPPELHDPEVVLLARGPMCPSSPPSTPPLPEGSLSGDEDEEAAFLAALEEEEAAAAAEEEAFLNGLEDDEDEDGGSTPAAPAPAAAAAAAAAAPSADAGASSPRSRVVYEPHDAVCDTVARFNSDVLKDKSIIDPAHLLRPIPTVPEEAAAVVENSPRAQVVYEGRARVNDLALRYAERCG